MNYNLKSANLKKKIWRNRILVIEFSFLILFSLAIWRFYDMQIKKGYFYSLKAKNQVANFKKSILRGNIYLNLENNKLVPASISKIFPSLYIVPKEIKKPKEVEKNILNLFPEIDKQWLESKLLKKNDPYELIKRKISPKEEKIVKNWELEGVYTKGEIERYFPFQKEASHILGFVSLNDAGQWEGKYGIERQFEKYLKRGDDIILTIDKNIQAEAELAINDLVKKWKAKSGQVIILESETGKVLAMASVPNFDPNEYFKYPLKNFLNPNIESVWEPGSVFKVLTMAIGLESGAIKPNTSYFDKGFVTLNKRTIYNWDKKGHGWQKMGDVLAKSLNTGAVFIESKIGHKKFLKYLKKFGINKKTGIQLPDEVSGSLRNLENNPKDINFATASFGQGVSVTPMEIIMAINTIADGGVLMVPRIVNKIITFDGREIDFGKDIKYRVISQETAEKVKEMMVKAVEHGKIGHISGYDLAAKTGTAQVPFKGKYLDKYVHTYIGFGPANNPKFTMLIKLDEPEGNILSGATVVPTFRKLAQFLFNYFKIPPKNIR